jgi:hypothetical protein
MRRAIRLNSMIAVELPVQRHVELELENSSYIEGRGVRHTHWDVRINDAWIPVDELRGVEFIRADPDTWFSPDTDARKVLPSGCQYRITFYPRLPIGTRVRRRISVPLGDPPRPKAPAREKPVGMHEALAQMLRAYPPPKPPLKTNFTQFIVCGEHKLKTDAEVRFEQDERRRRRQAAPAPAISAAEVDAMRAALGLPPVKR